MRYIKASVLILLFLLFISSNSFAQKKFASEGKSITVYTTADSANLRLTKTGNVQFTAARQPLETEVLVFVNPDKKFQEFVGVGGAATDAAAEVFAKLSPEKQEEFLTAYFDKDKGIGYSILRTNIHSCDFSSGSYTYIQEGDKNLKTFNIDHDRQYKLPLIKKAIAKAGGKMMFFASPWSPPAFMKSNNNMLKGGKLLPEYYQSWANYYTKFIKAYEAEGINVWGITVQNEPMATQTWESCIYTAEEERDFLKNFLGPTMAKAGLGNKKIVVWDHNRDLINHRANVILSDPKAAKYVWGVGFHWYETWTGGQPMSENVGNVKESFPDKNLLFTEGCVEKFDASKYQFWPNAERYGRNIINDFNNGTAGWTDWNLLLDENGGPNHANNFCFAPVHADTKTGDLIFTPSFYYLGHFSKFIRPGARMIATSSSRSQLLSTSFMNKDGKIATVVMNQGDSSVLYSIYAGGSAAQIYIPAHAIQTLVY
jgi:glucosylceramidase